VETDTLRKTGESLAPFLTSKEYGEDGLIGLSSLNKRMQELGGAYYSLEEFFLKKSIEKVKRILEFSNGIASC
jgi:hypothetical protein